MMKPESSRRNLVPQKSTIAPVVSPTHSELHSGKQENRDSETKVYLQKTRYYIKYVIKNMGATELLCYTVKKEFSKVAEPGNFAIEKRIL